MDDWGRKAVASAASAVGFIGLVATTGGAIQWIKFQAAQLPADQAINVTPKHELVTIGASHLILFAAAGVLAVLVVYSLDQNGHASRHTQVGLIALGAVAGIYAATRAAEAGWRVLIAALIAAVAPAIIVLDAPFSKTDAGVLAVRWRRLLWAVAGIFVLLLLVRVVLIPQWWFFLAILVAIALLLLDLGVAGATGAKFGWYGAAIFVSVGIFGFALNVLRTFHAPEVQPAIVLRSNAPSRPVVGIYVTQTENRIYLGGVDCRRSAAGRLEITPRSGRIYWLPLDKVTTVSIGPSKQLDEASESSGRIIKELEQSGLQATAATSAGKKPVAKKQAGAKPKPRSRQKKAAAASAAVKKAQVPPPGAICLPEPLPKKKQRPKFDGTTVTGKSALAVARRFRPVLLFDSEERWRPLNVPRFLAEYFQRPFGLDHHRLCAGESTLEASCRDVAGLADFERAIAGPVAKEEQTFLDISGGATVDDYCAPDRCGQEPADCDDCKKSAIYYHVSKANSRRYVDYWWFLRFNLVEAKEATLGCLKTHIRRCFNHEGDWEGVTVVTSAKRPYRLEYVTYAAHEKTIRYRRAQLSLQGERPFVYVARGTHAAYPVACSSDCRQSFRKVFPEGRHDGKAPWGRNAGGACFDRTPCLLPFPEDVRGRLRSWNAWTGHWGSCGNTGLRCTLGGAPVSPSQQPRFRNPACFDLGKRVLCDSPTPGTSAAPRSGSQPRQ